MLYVKHNAPVRFKMYSSLLFHGIVRPIPGFLIRRNPGVPEGYQRWGLECDDGVSTEL